MGLRVQRARPRFYRARGLVDLERTDGAANEEKAPDIRMAWPGSDPLAFYRSLIDSVDHDLGELLNRRAAITAAVQPHKETSERDLDREREIARALAAARPRPGRGAALPDRAPDHQREPGRRGHLEE